MLCLFASENFSNPNTIKVINIGIYPVANAKALLRQITDKIKYKHEYLDKYVS